jgi:hypothetical protein
VLKDLEPNDSLQKTLARRLELAERIQELTAREADAIQSGDWKNLEAVLDEKNRQIRAFQEAEKSLSRLKSLGTMLDQSPAHQSVLSRTESTLLAVQSVEEECRRLLTSRKNQTEKTLREIRRTRHAIRGFKPRRSGGPRFVDVRE